MTSLNDTDRMNAAQRLPVEPWDSIVNFVVSGRGSDFPTVGMFGVEHRIADPAYTQSRQTEDARSGELMGAEYRVRQTRQYNEPMAQPPRPFLELGRPGQNQRANFFTGCWSDSGVGDDIIHSLSDDAFLAPRESNPYPSVTGGFVSGVLKDSTEAGPVQLLEHRPGPDRGATDKRTYSPGPAGPHLNSDGHPVPAGTDTDVYKSRPSGHR